MMSGRDDLLKKIKDQNLISYNEGWRIKNVRFFSSTFKDEAQGRPEYLNLFSGIVEHSTFNSWVKIRRDHFTLRGIIPSEYAELILIINIIIIICFYFISKKISIQKYKKEIWFFEILILISMLLSVEVFIVFKIIDKFNSYDLRLLDRLFDILWWSGGAFLLCRGLESFLWSPLEIRTGRVIPAFLRRFIAIIIFLIAGLGIIAFVFGQKITSLLATSGVFAMIIGLAIQINISNIFSGIAINMERPFRIGDWVNIGEFEEGEVTDITWRATRLKTRDGCILSIPDSRASESVIKNFHYPDEVYELWFPVFIDPVHPAEDVEKILLDAALSVNIVLRNPYPIARFSGGLTDWAAKYYLIVCVRDRSRMNTYNGLIWKSILTSLQQSGITPARRQEIYIFQGDNQVKSKFPENNLNISKISDASEIWQPKNSETVLQWLKDIKESDRRRLNRNNLTDQKG